MSARLEPTPDPDGWTTLPNGLRVRKVRQPTTGDQLDSFFREHGLVKGCSVEDPFETEATFAPRGSMRQSNPGRS
jgi:hypothetical protein